MQEQILPTTKGVKKLIIAITGASGVIMGIRLVEELRRIGVETHLVISSWGERTIEVETNYTLDDVHNLANFCYPSDDLMAPISSGSFHTDGMVIIPCSMKTLSAIACGFSYNLIVRAADVTMKEHRQLILVPRETPFSTIHLQNMLLLSRMGVVILPPCIEFYTKPQTIYDIVNYLIGKVLDALGLEHELFVRWS